VSRLGTALAGVIAVVGVVLCFLASGDASVAASQPAQVATQQSILVDQQELEMELKPAAGSPEVDQSRALTLAKSYLAGSAQAKSVDARYVLLTFRDADGNIDGGVHDRPVWLVTFRGVSYVPSSSSASVCACSVVYERPSTVVTIDARNGALITLFGTDNRTAAPRQ